MKKEIIFFLTHKYNNQIANNIHKIYRQKGDRDFCILMHGENRLNDNSIPVRTFSLRKLSSLGFKMLNESEVVPGSTHLPLFYFFKEFQGYDNYWLIEYDVEYGGRWEHLFNSYDSSDADYISSYLTRYKNEKDWPWWELNHPQKEIPLEERVRVFHPIYRISNRAIQILNKELKTGWLGHSEVLIPTLANHNDLKLLDFAQGGNFSDPSYPNFYTRNFNFHLMNSLRFTSIFHLGTMRYRPAMKKAGFRKLLYHPVKSETGLTKIEEMKYLASLLGKRVMKIWSRI